MFAVHYTRADEKSRAWQLRKRFEEKYGSSFSPERLQCLSSCLVNMEIYGCQYSPEIMHLLRELTPSIREDISKLRNEIKVPPQSNQKKSPAAKPRSTENIPNNSNAVVGRGLGFTKLSSLHNGQNTVQRGITFVKSMTSYNPNDQSQNGGSTRPDPSILKTTSHSSSQHTPEIESVVADVTYPTDASNNRYPFHSSQCLDLTSNNKAAPLIKTTVTTNTEKNLNTETPYEASIDKAIPGDNIGNQLLRKMGWRGGGLGKDGSGIVEPVSQCRIQGRSGLGLVPKVSSKCRDKPDVTCPTDASNNKYPCHSSECLDSTSNKQDKTVSFIKTTVTKNTKSSLNTETPYEASIDTAIPGDNIGNQLLKKMGWSGGGLGKDGSGIVEPVSQCRIQGRSGLGLVPKVNSKCRDKPDVTCPTDARNNKYPFHSSQCLNSTSNKPDKTVPLIKTTVTKNTKSSLSTETPYEASIDIAIPGDNIGNQLLKKMGWSGGGLGKDGSGIVEPVSQCRIQGRSGLGLVRKANSKCRDKPDVTCPTDASNNKYPYHSSQCLDSTSNKPDKTVSFIKTTVTTNTENSLSTETPYEANIDKAIPGDNIGNQLLRKMGWSGGGLGKDGSGIIEPVTQCRIQGRSGLGLVSKVNSKCRAKPKDLLLPSTTPNSNQDSFGYVDISRHETPVSNQPKSLSDSIPLQPRECSESASLPQRAVKSESLLVKVNDQKDVNNNEQPCHSGQITDSTSSKQDLSEFVITAEEAKCLSGFVLLESSEYSNCTTTILDKSSQISNMKVDRSYDLEFSHGDGKWVYICTTKVAGVVVAKGIGRSLRFSRHIANEIAVENLRKTQWTIGAKQIQDFPPPTISRRHIVGDMKQIAVLMPGGRLLPSCVKYICGLCPANKTPLVLKSNSLQVVPEGLAPSSDEDVQMFVRIVSVYLQCYLESKNGEDLDFKPEFNNVERAIIHKLSRTRGLSTRSHGDQDNRCLVVSRNRSGHELVSFIRNSGGETSKYRLLHYR